MRRVCQEIGLLEFLKAHSICKTISMERPKIRAVEAFPVEQNGQTLICLRDSSGVAPNPILLGMGAYFIITLFNGVNDLRDVQAAFMKRFGQLLPLQQLSGLV